VPRVTIISTISYPLAITMVFAMSTDSDSASAELHKSPVNTFSPHAVPFTSRVPPITIISYPLAITKVTARSTYSDSASEELLKLPKPLSPHAVPFVPRCTLLLRTREAFTAPLSPPPSPTFRAGCNLSPSHMEAAKDDNWEAWRMKRKMNKCRPPLLSTSHQTEKSKFIPVTSFICHTSPDVLSMVPSDNIITLSNLIQEVLPWLNCIVLSCNLRELDYYIQVKLLRELLDYTQGSSQFTIPL